MPELWLLLLAGVGGVLFLLHLRRKAGKQRLLLLESFANEHQLSWDSRSRQMTGVRSLAGKSSTSYSINYIEQGNLHDAELSVPCPGRLPFVMITTDSDDLQVPFGESRVFACARVGSLSVFAADERDCLPYLSAQAWALLKGLKYDLVRLEGGEWRVTAVLSEEALARLDEVVESLLACNDVMPLGDETRQERLLRNIKEHKEPLKGKMFKALIDELDIESEESQSLLEEHIEEFDDFGPLYLIALHLRRPTGLSLIKRLLLMPYVWNLGELSDFTQRTHYQQELMELMLSDFPEEKEASIEWLFAKLESFDSRLITEALGLFIKKGLTPPLEVLLELFDNQLDHGVLIRLLCEYPQDERVLQQLLVYIKHESQGLVLAAVDGLRKVGTLVHVEPLRILAETRFQYDHPFQKAVKGAILSIQERAGGDGAGSLSLADGEEGKLSIEGRDGALSPADGESLG